MAAMDHPPTVVASSSLGTLDIMASRGGVVVAMTLTPGQAFALVDDLVREARRLPVEAHAADFTTDPLAIAPAGAKPART